MVKASGSVGANYSEANEKLGDKDFKFRLKIARKETKKAPYWLRLPLALNDGKSDGIKKLINEAEELKKILSAIINKFE